MSNQYVPPQRRFRNQLPQRLSSVGCWNWQGATSQGYGVLMVNGRKVYAHRYSLELDRGRPLPVTRVIDHLCRNRRCVNPAHLDLVTHIENIRRGIRDAEARRRIAAGMYVP